MVIIGRTEVRVEWNVDSRLEIKLVHNEELIK